MEVYILIECTDQSDFTERKHYCSAEDAREIKGVYSDPLKAEQEKERLEAISLKDQEECDCDPYYYVIEPHTVI